ncbi:VanW family protein [Caulobacter sp. NIBR1757]|uniref:VanW family protein n=1 Tax=Caulobacter sp. NIBR1757 TaxID=3016000 RepID=UPI0022F13069|nr:VanW family protein [Caulobacter sp. NIBR1757]WGM39815.1 hypothetical protein AMEJIAPC_02743 [Caulobacter sp. NIBR1757]
MNQVPDPASFTPDPDLDWWEQPSRLSGAIFNAKVIAFRTRRGLINLTAGLKPLTPAPKPADYVLLAEARSGLWTDERSREHRHQRGKVENLRRATTAIGAGKLEAGQVFSFWRIVGKATRRRGYVDGRMIQEGCLVPAVGGGLCQLSNALYDVAQRAGCEIFERHGHSKVVPGSASTHGRDATVAWNYVDLRFAHAAPLHIETRLTEGELIVRFSGPAAAGAAAPKGCAEPGRGPILEARSCDSCQQISCYRHEGPSPATASARRVWLVDEAWPEFQALWAEQAGPADVLGLPLDGGRWWMGRYAWAGAPAGRTRDAMLAALGRSAAVRRLASRGPERRRAELAGAEAIARSLERLLTSDDLDVVVAQSLLPYLWRRGRLGGRRFSVLMTRAPIGVLQARLDEAHVAAPEQASLADFRADPALVSAEAQALAAAHRILTPHAAVAALFGERAQRLDWIAPKRGPAAAAAGRRIAFPGPTAARKGAWTVREAARALDLEVVTAGSELEGAGFWDGVRARSAGADWLEGVAAVVQPAVVEDNPRRLLGALAAGVPVIATPACGLVPQPGLILIPPGNAAALIAALKSVMG